MYVFDNVALCTETKVKDALKQLRFCHKEVCEGTRVKSFSTESELYPLQHLHPRAFIVRIFSCLLVLLKRYDKHRIRSNTNILSLIGEIEPQNPKFKGFYDVEFYTCNGVLLCNSTRVCLWSNRVT